AHASATPSWGLVAGNLTSVLASGTTVTFTTSTPHGLVANDTVDGNGRVTIIGAISNFNLNGTYYVKTTPTPTQFTIQIANATNANYTFPPILASGFSPAKPAPDQGFPTSGAPIH
ncbi:MAG TPA: hypothetical protein VI216_09725, partial [Candidatus Acidoferrales bacterium]